MIKIKNILVLVFYFTSTFFSSKNVHAVFGLDVFPEARHISSRAPLRPSNDDLARYFPSTMRGTGWYTHEHMETLLDLRRQRLNRPDVYVFAALHPDQVSQGVAILESQLQQHLANHPELNQHILIPYNPTLNHWVGIYLRQVNGVWQAFYMDSSSTQDPPQNVFALFKKRLSVNLRKLKVHQQTDGHSCGPRTVENLMRALAAENLNTQTLMQHPMDATLIRQKQQELMAQFGAMEALTETASRQPTRPQKSLSHQLSHLSLSDHSSSLSGLTSEDENDTSWLPTQKPARTGSFSWQAQRHYEDQIRSLYEQSEGKVISVIKTIINWFESHQYLFESAHEDIVESARISLYSHLKDESNTGPLSRFAYEKEQKWEMNRLAAQQQSRSNSDRSWRTGDSYGGNSDDDEASHSDNSNENSGGYGRTLSQEEDVGNDEASHSDNSNEKSETEESEQDLSEDPEEDDVSNQTDFEKWQIQKLWNDYNIDITSMDQLTRSTLSLDNIKHFLHNHVEDQSGEKDPTWLLNAYLAELEVDEGLLEAIDQDLSQPRKLMSMILDYAQHDFSDFNPQNPLALYEVYMRSLSELVTPEDGAENGPRQRLISRFKHYLFSAPEGLTHSYEALKKDYDQAVAKNDWRTALVTWALYTSYQKVFQKSIQAPLAKARERKESISSQRSFSVSIAGEMSKAQDRAEKTYTKIYPAPSTRHLIYGAKKPRKRTPPLDLAQVLGRLKKVGQAVEPSRPVESGKKRKNIFVPTLTFVVSDRPHEKGGEHGRLIIEVPFDFPLPSSPISGAPEDGVFVANQNTEDYFFKKAGEDTKAGLHLMGRDDEIEGIENELKGAFKDSLFAHSERVLVQLLEKQETINHIVKILLEKIRALGAGSGTYKIYAASLMAYSTNTVCKRCTPTLVNLQNSYEKGFMALLIEALNQKFPHQKSESMIALKTRGYNPKLSKHNSKKFKLTTLVTASINFDEEAHDLADEGQHSFKGNTNPPQKTHLPHTKLFFPQNTIDLNDRISPFGPVEEESPQVVPSFYEFVGLTIHNQTDSGAQLPYPYTVFSSGRKKWSAPKAVLRRP